jgi:DNA-binding HxlR family transcriptional regulator
MARGSLELLKLDRMIHDPTRLLILTFLYPVAKRDYLSLRKMLGLTTGNLSRQLQKLEKAGIVKIEKGFKGKYPMTVCSMTKSGREAFEVYAQMLKEISKATENSNTSEK